MKYILTLCLMASIQGHASIVQKASADVKKELNAKENCKKTVKSIKENSDLLSNKQNLKYKYNNKQNVLETFFEDEKGKHSTSFSCSTGKMLQSVKQTHKVKLDDRHLKTLEPVNKKSGSFYYEKKCKDEAQKQGVFGSDFNYIVNGGTLYFAPKPKGSRGLEQKLDSMKQLKQFAKQNNASIKSFKCPNYVESGVIKISKKS